jgi:serine protease Do
MTGAKLAQYLSERSTMLVTLPETQAKRLLQKQLPNGKSALYLSTATPITADGFMMTAAHCVRAQPGDASVVLYSPGPAAKQGRAEVIWKDERSDLALIRVPFSTPHFYDWTPADKRLSSGLQVVHGGLSTGPKGKTGELLESMSGRSGWIDRIIDHSLRLEPGDSGGPLICTDGRLVAINRAVGYTGIMDTQFFVGSQSSRPDPTKIIKLIEKSRRSLPPQQ